MDINELKNIIESFLFVSSKPLTSKKTAELLEVDEKEVTRLLDQMKSEYDNRKGGLQIKEIGNGWEILTREEYGDWIKKFRQKENTFSLSSYALETLSVIAYKQPITKAEINEVRGVDSSGSLRTLLAKKLVKIAGRKKVVGKPILYATTQDFLRYFGLKDISEIPSLEETEG